MNFITPLFLGFITAFIGIIPPGLINMTAAKVNLKEGKKNALWFVIGAVVIIFFQVFLAILFAKIINRRPDLVTLLREVGLGIFATLTVYFLWLAKNQKTKPKNLKKTAKPIDFFWEYYFRGLIFSLFLIMFLSV